MNTNEIATCGECGLEGPLEQIQEHFLSHFDLDNAGENQGSNAVSVDESSSTNIEESVEERDQKLWPSSTVLLLIRLIESNYSSFDNTMKKVVWHKIAMELSKITDKQFTTEQVDTKWKGLKRTYKKIKDNNSTTGRSRKNWEFFSVMDSFLNKKPEYEAPATCSSSSGLSINKENEPVRSGSSLDETHASIKKRKKETLVERRHKEKIQRLDRFLDLYQMSVEHQIGKKVNNTDEDSK